MKKLHYKSLKFHTLYSFLLASIFILIIMVFPDIILGTTMAFLLLYVAGNGLIHARNNKLERDTMVEYFLLSVIVLLVIISAITR